MSTIPVFDDGSRKRTNYKALPGGGYPGRLVRFVGLGMQKQPDYDGKPKKPAFKVATQWQLFNPEDPSQPIFCIELAEDEATGKITEKASDRASCLFQDYFLFPNAERGKVFEMCKAFDGTIKKSPAKLDWFFEKVGQAAMVQVREFKRKDGSTGNAIEAIHPIMPMIAKLMPAATVDLVAFDPYVQDETNSIAYAKMYRYQQSVLAEALDAKFIPLAGTEPMVLDSVNTDKPATETDNKDTGGGAVQTVNVNPFDNFDDDIPF